MQIKNKLFSPIASILSFGLIIISACNKPAEISLKNEGSIYMPQAAGTRATLALRLADTVQTVTFGAAYGGLNYPGQDVSVGFKVDTTLVAKYNALNGTNYTVLPAASYSVSGLADVIKSGTTTSAGLQLGISTSKIKFGTHYLLPITLTTASSGKIDSSLQTAYFAVDTITRLSIDVTTLGTLSVNNENSGGIGASEGSPKVVDGDLTTKYLCTYLSNMYIQLKYGTAVAVGAYTLTSGGDAATRDPQNWNLAGSNDGTNWTVVDTRTNQVFPNRTQTIRFEVPGTPAAFTYYRLNITANATSSLFQMSEMRFFTYK